MSDNPADISFGAIHIGAHNHILKRTGSSSNGFHKRSCMYPRSGNRSRQSKVLEHSICSVLERRHGSARNIDRQHMAVAVKGTAERPFDHRCYSAHIRRQQDGFSAVGIPVLHTVGKTVPIVNTADSDGVCFCFQLVIRRFRCGQGCCVGHKRLLVCGQVVIRCSRRGDLRAALGGVDNGIVNGVDQGDHIVGSQLIDGIQHDFACVIRQNDIVVAVSESKVILASVSGQTGREHTGCCHCNTDRRRVGQLSGNVDDLVVGKINAFAGKVRVTFQIQCPHVAVVIDCVAAVCGRVAACGGKAAAGDIDRTGTGGFDRDPVAGIRADRRTDPVDRRVSVRPNRRCGTHTGAAARAFDLACVQVQR